MFGTEENEDMFGTEENEERQEGVKGKNKVFET
jgi:hypothetical protein